jgi:hypothetical protein
MIDDTAKILVDAHYAQLKIHPLHTNRKVQKVSLKDVNRMARLWLMLPEIERVLADAANESPRGRLSSYALLGTQLKRIRTFDYDGGAKQERDVCGNCGHTQDEHWCKDGGIEIIDDCWVRDDSAEDGICPCVSFTPPAPQAESLQAKVPLCEVHQSLDQMGELVLDIENSCVACKLNERNELLVMLAPYAEEDDDWPETLMRILTSKDEYDRGYSDAKFDIANQLRERMTQVLIQRDVAVSTITSAVYGYIEELEDK